MSSYLLRLFCVLFFCKVAITDSQDIVGCGGFIKSEVEINFSVIEVCTCHLTMFLVFTRKTYLFF